MDIKRKHLIEHKKGAARAELRALLAVVRAALPVLLALDAVMNTMPMVLWPGRADAVVASAKLRRALARLDRVSGGKP